MNRIDVLHRVDRVAIAIVAALATTLTAFSAMAQSGPSAAGAGTPAAGTEPLPTLAPVAPPASTGTPPAAPNLDDVGVPAGQFGHLGVTVDTLPNGDGLRVVGIEPTSPAFPAGLLIGDEITSINGKRVAKFSDLVAGLRKAAEGDGNVSLLVLRRGTLDTVNIMVGGKKAVTTPPRLGVTLDDSNGRLRVTGVEPDSPAARPSSASATRSPRSTIIRCRPTIYSSARFKDWAAPAAKCHSASAATAKRKRCTPRSARRQPRSRRRANCRRRSERQAIIATHRARRKRRG